MKKSNISMFNNVIALPTEDSGLQNNIVRFENSNVKFFGRRTPVIITNSDNNQSVIRYVMGNNGSIKGLTRKSLAVDYDALVDLQIQQYGQPVLLAVRQASLIQCMTMLNNSPDLNIKISFRLGVLGAVLGFIGLLTSVISLL